MTRGALVVVGSGIKSLGHVTLEAEAWIRRADKVLYGLSNPATAAWVRRLNPTAEDLDVHYQDDGARLDTYRAMTARMLEPVRRGLRVCVVLYGHPGFFVNPSHDAIRQARAEGYHAEMLPGVSALDCLIADLGVDPAEGCQILEATDLVACRRRLMTDAHVILLQVDAVGDLGFASGGHDARHLPVLVEVLASAYGPDHEGVLYVASQFPVTEPVHRRVRVGAITAADVAAAQTLYLRPRQAPTLDPAMAVRLGLGPDPTPTAEPGGAPRLPIPYRPVRTDSRLVDFIETLSRDPARLDAFREDPAGTLACFGGLTPGEIAAVLSGEPGRIRVSLTAQPVALGAVTEAAMAVTWAPPPAASP